MKITESFLKNGRGWQVAILLPLTIVLDLTIFLFSSLLKKSNKKG